MAKKLTKKEKEQLEKQNAHQSMMAEAQQFIDSVHAMQEWQNGTPEYQTEMLDHYENNIWAPYALERWGNDVVTANSYKNSFLQPLRSEIAKRQADMNTWGNTLSNALASVQRGGDILLDAGHAIATVPSAIRESVNYNRIVELQNQMRDIAQSPGAYASPDEQAAAYAAAQAELDTLIPQYEANRPIYEQDIQNLAQELATSGSKEAQRRAAIPQRMNDYIRQQEIERREKLEGNEDPWTVWHLVAENPRYLANLILEQGANMLPQLAAATAGGLVAGPVGGTVASSAVGSLMGAGQVASGIAEEIFNADVNTLAGLPQYDELRKLGYSDRDARIQIAAKAIEEAVPGAAALTAATSIIGPETMLAKSSILQPLIKGGALRRVATAGALSAPGEAVEEGGQQVFQNIGWNAGTGDQRDIMQGVGEAASLGALLGGVMGGAGGIRRPSYASGPASNDTTPPPVQGQPTPEPTPTPTATNLSGGSTDSQSPQAEGQPALSPILNESSRAGAINVPGQTVEGPVAGGVDNVNYNPSTTERAIRASEVMRLASEQVDAISANPSTDPMALYGLLMEAENLGVNPDFVDGILGNVQDVYNRDPNNTGDVRATYESVRASTRKPSGDTDVQQQDPLQPTVLGQQGQADQGGSDTGGTSTGSRPAAAPTGTDPSNITTGTQAAGGTDAAAQGSGSGGTAYTGAGTSVGNVQTNQSVGRSSGQGANSGRDNSPNGPGNAQSDSGNGGDTTTPEQRTSDGGRAQQSGGTQTGGVATTGYATENTISLSMPNPDGTYSVREYNTDTTTVEDILNEVNTSLAAQADAAADAAAANAATIAEEAYANPDNLMAQAKLEAAQDPADMTSPLVVYADMDEQMLADIANGNYPAEVQAAIQDDNSILTDVVSTTVRGTDSDLATPVQPTPEEEAAVHEQLVVELNEGLADNGDGTTTLLSLKHASPATQQAAQAIQDLELRASLQRGAEFRAAQVEQVSKTVYAGAWKPGLWAKAATWLRKHMVDGGAHFYLFTLQHFSPVNADPANNPVWKTFSTLSNNIYGAAKIFTENVLNPIQSWSEGIARQYNIDPDKLAHDAGLYRTCLHTIEAAYKRQIELENDLQKAYAMPTVQTKADAIITAEEALERFADRQMGKRKDVDVYGGRSVAEAQAEIDRLISEMDALTDGQGRALLDEGNAHMHNGLRWITRWLMENGQLSEADALRFDDWNYYTPLTIETLANDKANSDIFYYAPRQNFHRNGSTTPAQDGYQALIQYGCRASRSVGMSEFSYVMYEAYQTLKARGNLTGKLDGINFYDGMGLMPTDYINAVAHGDIHASNETVTWAKGVQENATTVIRVVQPDPNTGISTTKSYYVMFAKLDNNGKIERDENVAQAVRNPFKAASPHVFLDIMAKTTSGYAQIYTRLRPYFPVLTSVRDMIERLSYIPTRVYTNESGETVQGYKIAAQMVGFAMNPANFYRLVRYWTSGTSGSSYFDQHMDDFFNSGADMSGNYNKMLSTLRKQSVTAIENNIPSSIQKLGKKRVKEVVGTISKWGDFFYSLPAFAQFIKMRENKIDMRQTVYGITTLMNMQQRGNFAGLLGTIYPFVNSIGQTASNLLYTMGLHTLTFGNHPNANRLRVSAIKGWAVMFGTYAAMRVLIPHVAASLMGDDEDKEKGQQRLDMIPLGQFATFIPVGVGDGSYVKWPTGFGPAAFGNLFAFGIDRIERGKLSYGDFMATALTTFGKSLVPNSMPAFEFSKDPVAFIIQSMTPMLGAPAMQIATNRTYSGQQITYDTYNRLERSSDKQNITTHMVWSEWAKNLYKYTDGMWDLTPEEVRTGVSGYLGGVAQGLVSWLEADPLYKHPMYETTREKLGPFWTAFGATSIYNAAINLERTAYYEAREHYEKMIRASGVGSIIKGDEQDKRKVLAAAGFTQPEIDDYINLSKTEKYLSDMNSNFRKELDKLYGPDMEESVIRQKFSNWSMEQHRVFSELMPKLNFYNPDNRRRWGAPDEQASRELRGEVPFSAVEPGTTTLNNRTIPRNTDGSIAAQATHIIQDVDGLQVIIPTIGPNGERWTIEQAMDNYFRTKQHLGKYRSMEAAQKAVETLQR